MAKITLSYLTDDNLDLIDVHITDLQGDLTVWEGDKPIEMPTYSNISFLFALEPLELKELGKVIEQILLQRRKDYPSLPQYDEPNGH